MEHRCKKTDIKAVKKCELNREQIGKILDIIFDKVGAFGMYAVSPTQAMMILKIIKELTEENESLKQAMEHEHASFMEIFGQYGEKCDRLTEENERLRARNIVLEQKLIILGCDEQYFFKPKVKGETANEN